MTSSSASLPITVKNAAVVAGRARGRRINIPTINIDLGNIPKELRHGIYACWIIIDQKKYAGAMHYGPRPAFKDTEAFEVHIIDAVIAEAPHRVDVEVIEKIRDVEDFASIDALVARIQKDIDEARAILKRQ